MLPDRANAQICPPATYTIINIPPNITVNESPLPGLLPAPGSATIVQRVVIRGGGSILFVNSYTFAPGSEIIFQDQDPVNILGKLEVAPGVTLTLVGTTVRGCELYEGITVRSGGTLSMLSGSTIQDAFAAVTLKDQSSLNANSAIFRSNYIGIFVEAPTTGGTRINVNLSLTGNEFYGQNPLLETLFNGEYYPHFGIRARDVVNVNVDASSGPPNLFSGFTETIDPVNNFPVAIATTNANLTVKNAIFRNNGQLGLGGPDKPANGIYAVNLANGSSSGNLIVTGSTFEDGYDGITFYGGNLTVTEDTFSYGNIHLQILETLLPFSYNIRRNSFDTYIGVGVKAFRNFPSQSFNLTDNHFYDNSVGFMNPSFFSQAAVSLISTNTANTNISVLNNTYNISPGSFGIYGFLLNLGKNSLLEGNIFTSDGSLASELYLLSTRSAKAYRNSFTGAMNGGQGIWAVEAYQSSIICNTLDKLAYGVYFEGNACDGTTLAENTFGTHNSSSLYLHDAYDPMFPKNTTIGQQIHNRNVWPTSGSSLEADYPVSTSDPAYFTKLNNSEFDIQVAETSSPNYWAIPRYPALNLWFKYLPPPGLIPYKCPPKYGEPGGGGKDEKGLSKTDENVIAGTQPIYNEFDATLWDAQVRLYRNLYENPELRPEGSEAEAFYTANGETTYARLAIMLSRYDQALTTDSITLEQLGNLYAQGQVAQEEQSENLEALNQETALLLNSVADARNERLNSLQNDLTTVDVSTEYEINLKTVLTIMVTSALSDSPWHWTDEQTASLQSIAAQCKLPGGYGVVLARLMLEQTNPAEEGCTVGVRSAQATGTERMGWKISPNPTSGSIQISLPKSTEIRFLDLYDQWGHKIRTQKIGAESAFSWNLGDLPNGMYYMKLIGGQEAYFVQKIVIQH